MIAALDRVLDRVTMYRLVLYYLIALLLAALVAAELGLIPYTPLALAFSTMLILAVCVAANVVFSWAFKVSANRESAIITALILVLILDPMMPADTTAMAAAVMAGVWAIAAKFMLAVRKRHIFNPAAFGVALAAIAVGQPASWWVGGNLALLPFVLVGGILLLRRLRRVDVATVFALVAIVATVAAAAPGQRWSALTDVFAYTPLLFFAFIMITEPITMPPGRVRRLAYAALVGLLFSPVIHFGATLVTPEQALLAGNLFAFLLSPRGRTVLTLDAIRRVAAGVYDFSFTADRPLPFRPGQYVELTLPAGHADDRGSRRYFTVASAPDARTVDFGVKFYPAPSTFKERLAALQPGETVLASPADGDFVLPRWRRKGLVFIAGGIGITPFKSMIEDMLARHDQRPVVLFYANEHVEDVAYVALLERARREIGLRTIYTLAREANPPPGFIKGLIDYKLLIRELKSLDDWTFYISGPRAMVVGFLSTLVELGVRRRHIRVDFFPGLAPGSRRRRRIEGGVSVGPPARA